MLDIFSDKYNFIIEEVDKIITGEGCRDAGFDRTKAHSQLANNWTCLTDGIQPHVHRRWNMNPWCKNRSADQQRAAQSTKWWQKRKRRGRDHSRRFPFHARLTRYVSHRKSLAGGSEHFLWFETTPTQNPVRLANSSCTFQAKRPTG